MRHAGTTTRERESSKNAGEEMYDYRKSEWMKGIREEEDEESESGKAGKSLVANLKANLPPHLFPIKFIFIYN